MSKIIKTMHGRTVPLVLILGMIVAVLVGGTFFNPHRQKSDLAKADTATTSVTVTNTAPQWTVDAEESPASSSSTPTDVASTTRWVGTGSDSNAEPYYLIICTNANTPTPSTTGAPWCTGAAMWAVSPSTPSDQTATATRTALAGDAELNNWWAFICDANGASPQCNNIPKQGNGNTDKSSPFVVNHRPVFTIFTDDGPWNPGSTVTWTASSTDYDVASGTDSVQLVVCKANDYDNVTNTCGGGGTYCTSSLVSSTPTCNFVLENPKQDQNYAAYGFVHDNHEFEASGGAHGTDSVLTINNVQPTISTSTIYLLDADEVGGLTLVNERATTTGFHVRWTASDDNSCINASSGDEIVTAKINVYRSAITQAGCDQTGEFNANNCYVGSATGFGTWRVNAAQDPGTCNGANDKTADWTATFTLWYIADPTDGTTASDSPYFAQNWMTSVQSYDDQYLSSTSMESVTGNEVISFLAIDLLTPNIAYGSLSPGSQNSLLTVTTTISATGNVGIDEALTGSAMCTTYPSCSGSATDTIHVANQKYTATSSPYLVYGDANAIILTSTTAPELEVNGFKSTATTTQASTSTWWAVRVPAEITKAGDYTGQNTIYAVKSEGTQW